MINVLFVCMGNICRSPTAHGIFQHQIEAQGLDHLFTVDSAGTHGSHHLGSAPDVRAMEVARSRGVDLSGLRSRQLEAVDCEIYDHILVMDRDNYDYVWALCPPANRDRIQYLMAFAPKWGTLYVPDPYYGGPQGFEQVFDMIASATANLLDRLVRLKQANG